MIHTLTFSYMFEPQEMGTLLHDQFISKDKAHVWLLFVRLYAHDSCYHKSSPLWSHLEHWTTSKSKLVNLKILGVVVHHIWKGKESSMALSVRNSVFPVLLPARMPLDGAWGWQGRMAAVEILQGHFSNIGPFHCHSFYLQGRKPRMQGIWSHPRLRQTRSIAIPFAGSYHLLTMEGGLG